MATLRIQHAVSNYSDWKQVFDSDPIDRKGGGVRHYQLHQLANDPNYVLIDLEFDHVDEAEAFLEKLRGVWAGPARDMMRNPQAQIIELVESGDV